MLHQANENSDLSHLAAFNLFDHFEPSDLDQISQELRSHVHRAGNEIRLPRVDKNRLYYLSKGTAKFSQTDRSSGKSIILYLLKTGDLFDDAGAGLSYSGHVRNSIVALEDCRAAYIRKLDLTRLMQKYNIYFDVSSLVAKRLSKLTKRIDELFFGDVPCRLARTLLRLSDEYRILNSGAKISLPLSQADMACLIGANGTITSQTLSRFSRNGWIQLNRKSILLRNRVALEKQAM